MKEPYKLYERKLDLAIIILSLLALIAYLLK